MSGLIKFLIQLPRQNHYIFKSFLLPLQVKNFSEQNKIAVRYFQFFSIPSIPYPASFKAKRTVFYKVTNQPSVGIIKANVGYITWIRCFVLNGGNIIPTIIIRRKYFGVKPEFPLSFIEWFTVIEDMNFFKNNFKLFIHFNYFGT